MLAVDPTNHDDEQCTSGRVKSDITVLLFEMIDGSLIVSHDRVVVHSRPSTSALVVPRTRLAVGDRAFYVAAARTWNMLSSVRLSVVSVVCNVRAPYSGD